MRSLLWIYSALLRLYPAAFRKEFGEEMRLVFSDALADTWCRSRSASLRLFLHEVSALPASLLRERWTAAWRIPDQASSEPWTRPPANWQAALLAGLPHLLYALAIYFPLATAAVLGRGTGLLPEPFTFWLLVLGVLVLAWRRAWPVWSASWIGYALVFGLERTLSAGPNTWLADLKFIAWLAAALAVIFWLVRRDWLSGLLAVLPLAPMRVWWLGGEAASGFLSQALTFTSIGLMVCMAVTAMLRSGRWQTAVLLILAVELAAGIPVPYAGLAPPAPPANLPNLGVANIGLLLLFTAPLWLLALWRQARGRLPG